MNNAIKTGDIYEIRLRNWSGRPIDKTTFSTTEKAKAAMAISRIMDNCDLDVNKFQEIKNTEFINEHENQINIKKKVNQPIQWRRDARGNII
jgi:hypothetical protein